MGSEPGGSGGIRDAGRGLGDVAGGIGGRKWPTMKRAVAFVSLTILLLGAGGAGRTAALKLASEHVSELWLVNRTPAKADAVAKEIRERHPDVKVKTGYSSGPVDLVLNATSLGLKPNDLSPLDGKPFALPQAGAVYDMIYRPAETALLKDAKAAGCRTANGLGMLLYQGAKALELWTGQTAPLETMRQALEKNLYD